MKTFPQPLTAKEEKRYLEEFRKGDQAAKDILIERNMRLVAHMVKKYTVTDREMEDLISVGSIGLIKAVHTFDPEKGSRLGTYAAKCIDNEILMLLRSQKKQSREVSLQEPVGIDKEGNEITLLDLLESEVEPVEFLYARKESIVRMAAAFQNCLTDKEKTVIRMRYGLDGKAEATQREIAARLGISRSYVSRIEKCALLKMRMEMEKEGHINPL